MPLFRLVSALLNDWLGVNAEKVLEFIWRCRVGVCLHVLPPSLHFTRPTKAVMAPRQGAKHKVHTPECSIEADVHFAGADGPTYLEMAIFRLATNSATYLSESERQLTLWWLLQNQDKSGGSHGRTNRDVNACQRFRCGGGDSGISPILLSGPPLMNRKNRCSE